MPTCSFSLLAIFSRLASPKSVLAIRATTCLAAVCLCLCTPAIAALVLDDLEGYSNTFNHLAFQGQSNSWTDDQTIESSSGSPGWFWQNENMRQTYEAGSTTSSGPFSLGHESNRNDRAMGSFSDADNQHTTWGIVFQNNSGQTISQVNVSYMGEQWRRAEANTDRLHFSFSTSTAAIEDFNPTGGAVPSGWTSTTSLSFAAPLSTLAMLPPGTPAHFNPAEVDNDVSISSTITVTIPDGHYLALRWYDGDINGSDAALGIDNLTVGFSTVVAAVPEPSAFLFGTVVIGFLGAKRRRQKVNVGG